MITLALGADVYFFSLQAPLPGGEDGIQGVPRGKLFGLIGLDNQLVMYAFVLAIFLAVSADLRAIHSPSPGAEAIRENEARAISLATTPTAYKLLAFRAVGHAGGLAARPSAGVPVGVADRRAWSMSGEVVLMTLLGGWARSSPDRVPSSSDAELPGAARCWVTVVPGRDLCGLRDGFPPRLIGELGHWLKKRFSPGKRGAG